MKAKSLHNILGKLPYQEEVEWSEDEAAKKSSICNIQIQGA